MRMRRKLPDSQLGCLRATGRAEVVGRSARARAGAYSHAAAEVRKCERRLAVTDVRRTEQREQRLVLVDWKQLPRAERPTLGREVERMSLISPMN